MTARRPAIRITGGSLKGRSIGVPAGLSVRPMRSRVREALFTILGDRIPGARFLDVFAGSGALAIEALSRGARQAVLIENHPRVLTVLERNLEHVGLRKRSRIVRIDVYTDRLRERSPFDVIFLDPPFPHFDRREANPWDLVRDRSTLDLVAPAGTLGLEFPARLDPPDPPPELLVETQRRYGDTAIILWRRG